MAFLENPQVEEQPQVQTPQVEEPPKKKKLWSGLQQKKLYTKSYEDFIRRMTYSYEMKDYCLRKI